MRAIEDVTMDEQRWLLEQFEENLARLRAVAYRMLGSATEADDAVQEAWLRLNRADTNEVENLPGWLTTVVARVCLSMLRSRRTRREDPWDELSLEPEEDPTEAWAPEEAAVLADSVGPALLVVLDTLGPAERLAFVLHDMFAVPFSEIAQIVGRSPEATRQLASRARRRVQGADVAGTAASEVSRQREIVDAFLAAARRGDFDALLALLDPDVVLRADAHAVRAGAAAAEVRGAEAVAGGAMRYGKRARAGQVALIDGSVGLLFAPGGRVTVAVKVTTTEGRIAAIDIVADPDRIRDMKVEVMDASSDR